MPYASIAWFHHADYCGEGEGEDADRAEGKDPQADDGPCQGIPFQHPPLGRKTVLDLFAGAGSVGLEAVSRGASWVILVESHRGCAEAIRKNIERCGFVNIPLNGIEGGSRQEIEVLEVPVDRGLKLLGHRRERFDVIFADPPYERNLIGETLRLIRAQALMSQDGVLVVQHSAREEIPARREGIKSKTAVGTGRRR